MFKLALVCFVMLLFSNCLATEKIRNTNNDEEDAFEPEANMVSSKILTPEYIDMILDQINEYEDLSQQLFEYLLMLKDYSREKVSDDNYDVKDSRDRALWDTASFANNKRASEISKRNNNPLSNRRANLKRRILQLGLKIGFIGNKNGIETKNPH